MSILDIFRISSIKSELESKKQSFAQAQEEIKALNSTIEETGAGDVLVLKKTIEENELALASLRSKINEAAKREFELGGRLRSLKESIIELEEEVLLESFALYKPKFAFTNSSEYKQALSDIRKKQKEFIKADAAAVSSESWKVNNSLAQGRKMIGDMKKLLLRSFNNECDYCVDNVKFNNIERFQQRIEKSFEAINKLGRVMEITIAYAYKDLKIDELKLAFEYAEKKQEEKEETRRLREEQREQKRVEQEIKAARDKIAKERKHFSAALADLQKKLFVSIDSNQQDIQRRIEEISGKLVELEGEEKIVDYRENNAKAGYVYIISNIGAFGEGVYKIGMTRRLEPMERVYELGDASVPFAFDVHAMIFSDDAPSLEAKLHNHFWENRLNKINGRKEFFKADLREVERVVRENYDRVFDMIHQTPAEQYREGLKMIGHQQSIH